MRTSLDGRGALEEFAESIPDLVILDLGLPDLDGLAVLYRIRSAGQVPVLVLSARHSAAQKVAALDAGADDYVTKPFGVDELFARVRAALRRGAAEPVSVPAILEADDLRIDFAGRVATRDGQPVHLTPTEWRILTELARLPGQLVPHLELLRNVWGPAYGRETNYLRVYLAQLRRKLERDPSRPRHLITEPGVGYRLVLAEGVRPATS